MLSLAFTFSVQLEAWRDLGPIGGPTGWASVANVGPTLKEQGSRDIGLMTVQLLKTVCQHCVITETALTAHNEKDLMLL